MMYIYIIIKTTKTKTMKNLFLFFALAFGIVSMNSCSKEDVTTPCPTNPFNGQTLCGTWLMATGQGFTLDSSYTITWRVYRTDINYIDVNTIHNSNNTNLTYTFSVSPDTILSVKNVTGQVVGEDKFRMSSISDTLVLTKTDNGEVYKFTPLP